MLQRKPDLRDPTTAVILAFLVPGLGHLYQQGVFKGALYAVCILGTFFTGLRIGPRAGGLLPLEAGPRIARMRICASSGGAPRLAGPRPGPPLARSLRRELRPQHSLQRFFRNASAITRTAPRSEGDRDNHAASGEARQCQLLGRHARRRAGHPDGTKKKIKGDVQKSGGWLEAQVAPWRNRAIRSQFKAVSTARTNDDHVQARRFHAPHNLGFLRWRPCRTSARNELAGESSDLDRAHKELGGRFELGVLYTMIAGLLNILAMYDAYEGPAYERRRRRVQVRQAPPPPPPPPA